MMNRHMIQYQLRKGLKLGKDIEVILNQKVELSYQFEVQDHIYAQVQFQKMDNLPKCQCDS